jgi:hypothetical protein
MKLIRYLFAGRLRICYGDNCLLTIIRTFIDGSEAGA